MKKGIEDVIVEAREELAFRSLCDTRSRFGNKILRNSNYWLEDLDTTIWRNSRMENHALYIYQLGMNVENNPEWMQSILYKITKNIECRKSGKSNPIPKEYLLSNPELPEVENGFIYDPTKFKEDLKSLVPNMITKPSHNFKSVLTTLWYEIGIKNAEILINYFNGYEDYKIAHKRSNTILNTDILGIYESNREYVFKVILIGLYYYKGNIGEKFDIPYYKLRGILGGVRISSLDRNIDDAYKFLCEEKVMEAKDKIDFIRKTKFVYRASYKIPSLLTNLITKNKDYIESSIREYISGDNEDLDKVNQFIQGLKARDMCNTISLCNYVQPSFKDKFHIWYYIIKEFKNYNSIRNLAEALGIAGTKLRAFLNLSGGLNDNDIKKIKNSKLDYVLDKKEFIDEGERKSMTTIVKTDVSKMDRDLPRGKESFIETFNIASKDNYRFIGFRLYNHKENIESLKIINTSDGLKTLVSYIEKFNFNEDGTIINKSGLVEIQAYWTSDSVIEIVDKIFNGGN